MTSLPAQFDRAPLSAADLNGLPPQTTVRPATLGLTRFEVKVLRDRAQNRLTDLYKRRQAIWYAGLPRPREVANLTDEIDEAEEDMRAMRAVRG